MNRKYDLDSYSDLSSEMNPMTLEFHDAIDEKNYITTSNKDNAVITQFWIVLTVLLFLVYGVLDPYTYPQQYHYIWIIRAVVVLFLSMVFVYTFNKNYVDKIQTIAFMQIFIVGGGLILMFLFPEENSYKYVFIANYVLIPTGMFVMTGLKFKNTLLAAIVLTLIIYIIVITQFDILGTAYYIFLFTSVTVISIGGAYFTELYRRKLFLKEMYTSVLLKELKEANDKFALLSVTDELTQVKNRRSFNEIIKREIRRARRDKTQIAFIMVDIDFFKLYNDSYGHLKGDEALVKVAQAIENTFGRSHDFVFRLGGEEFGVLLCDTNRRDSEKLALKMCSKIRELKLEHKASNINDFVTVSAGVCCRTVDSEIDENIFMKNADDALYAAKEAGRNRCVFV